MVISINNLKNTVVFSVFVQNRYYYWNKTKEWEENYKFRKQGAIHKLRWQDFQDLPSPFVDKFTT